MSQPICARKRTKVLGCPPHPPTFMVEVKVLVVEGEEEEVPKVIFMNLHSTGHSGALFFGPYFTFLKGWIISAPNHPGKRLGYMPI